MGVSGMWGVVRRWLKRVAVQSLRMHDHFFRNLTLANVQLNELVGNIKGATRRHFIWTAIDAATKIIPVWHVGAVSFKMPRSSCTN